MTATMRSVFTKHLSNIIIFPLLLAGIYAVSLYSYLLFHIVAEGFSIVIAAAIFLIAWNTRQLSKNNYVLFLSIALLFPGIIDFVHTVAYKGMGIFTGFDANLPTQLWIIARYLQSLSFLAAPWFIDRKLPLRTLLVIYFLLTLLLLAAVFSGGVFPDCFIEGRGLTPFKVVSEYVICLILVVSLAWLHRQREKFHPEILWLITGAIIGTIISELAFTFYISVYGLSNLIGHFFKIFAFYLIYRAIVVTGLKNPYGLLFYELQKNREELQTIFDASPAMIFYKDCQNTFIQVNTALAMATGLPKEAMEGKSAFEIYPDQAAVYWQDDQEVIASGRPKIGIIEPLPTATGVRWLQTDKIAYRDKEDRIVGIIGFAVDITDRRESEDKLRSSLLEKEMLLKEIHHRVKNNLQIISSLLRLQAHSLRDEKLEGIFQECQDRIASMAHVHQLLYKSQNFAAIDFGEYLRETAAQLFRSYRTGTAAIGLVIEADDDLLLPIETAIPCGLILNELITNALKYAFPGGRNGQITIKMHRTAREITLLFEDNGIGFPPEVDLSGAETLGLNLIHMLVKQIDGAIELSTDNGTRYLITMNEDAGKETQDGNL